MVSPGPYVLENIVHPTAIWWAVITVCSLMASSLPAPKPGFKKNNCANNQIFKMLF
jgi:hypothetical protein